MARKYPRFQFSEILTQKRECTSDWLIIQAECLVRFAKEKVSATALVYAALESRNAIEQLFLEMIGTCRVGKLDEKLIKECQKTEGVFRQLKVCEPDYWKLVRFTKMLFADDPTAPCVVEWDIRKLRRFHNDLSKYCHFQAIPRHTTSSPLESWLSGGIALVEEVFDYFENTMGAGHTAVADKTSFPPEVAGTWEEFRAGSITENDARVRLTLMGPALARRRLVVP
jgi:hypothetical protein